MVTPPDDPPAIRQVVIGDRFNGPEGSANGGYACGLLAGALGVDPGAVRVRLHAPPPLGQPLELVSSGTDDGGSGSAAPLRALHGDTLVAEATPAAEPHGPLAFVPLAAAREAEERFRGLAGHPYPTCFACGPARESDHGLHLRPGPLPDQPHRTACAWTPTPEVAGSDGAHAATPAVWAALDCPGGWTSDIVGRPMLLGQMTARVRALPRLGAPHVVVGSQLSVAGRKVHTATTLFDADGTVLATADHIWIIVRQE